MFDLEALAVVEVLQDGGERPPVPVVSDSAPVVALARQVGQSRKGDGVEGVHHQVQLPHGNPEVRVVEVVELVPAEGAEPPSLSDDAVEEGQGEEELLPLGGLGVGVEGLLLGLGGFDLGVGAEQGGLEAFGRFAGEFDGVLEDGEGEEVGGHGGQPQAEFRVSRLLFLFRFFLLVFLGGSYWLLRLKRLNQLLQLRQEAHRQVAVLQDDPAAVALDLIDEGLGLFALALAQRHRVGYPGFLLAEHVDLLHGVVARRQYEYNGHVGLRVRVHLVQAEYNGLDEEGAQGLIYVALHHAHSLLSLEHLVQKNEAEVG